MLSPPTTLAGQRRKGYLLVAVAVVLAGSFAVVTVTSDHSWTRLVGVFLVAGLVATAGLRDLFAARRGDVLVDEETLRWHHRAGYHAFVVLFVVIGSDVTFGLLDGVAHGFYLWSGLLAFLGTLAYGTWSE